MAGVDFFDVAVERAEIILLVFEIMLGLFGDESDKGEADGNGEESDEGHIRTDAEHHDDNTDEHGDRSDDLAEGLVEALGDGIDVVGDAA